MEEILVLKNRCRAYQHIMADKCNVAKFNGGELKAFR